MLSYDVKTYERFFWMLYKDAFKQAVKGFFRADEHQRSEFLNYFKYLQAYNLSQLTGQYTKWELHAV